MSISIISASFYESTFPLAKYIASQHEVDLYCVMQKSFMNPSMMDISMFDDKIKLGIYDADKTAVFLPSHVKQYFKDVDINIKMVVFSGGKNIVKDLLTSIRFVCTLRKSRSSTLHFIGTYVLFTLIERLLPKRKIVHTLHESSDRVLMLDQNKLKHLLFQDLFRLFEKKPIRLIFHSENVRKAFHQKHKKSTASTKVIPFGLFEGYNSFEMLKDLLLPEKPFLLFVGYIHPYKGVDLLIQAAESLLAKEQDIPIVIAGKDATGIEDRFSLPANVMLINKFLTEAEIVTLVNKCYAVVLPYTSSSQSGIPNVAFCFNKPIIASDLDGIKDIVYDRVNGLLFSNGDTQGLEQQIYSLWQETALYQQLRDNIQKKENLEWMKWDSIANSTVAFYQN